MKTISMYASILSLSFLYLCSGCNEAQKDNSTITNDSTRSPTTATSYGGFESQVAWGKHLVIIGGCNDCHTPKKMGAHGPEDNMDLELSGHPSQVPVPDIDRKQVESKGLMVAGGTFTAFVGPWGISYAANITSDSTSGIGNWTFDQFKRVFRTGKYNGAPQGRDLLPPMPWQNVGQMTDDELGAVFAYLQSTKPIRNIVPQPQPPVSAMKK